MGKSNMGLVLEVDGTTLRGRMEILRKKQPIQWGVAATDGFEAFIGGGRRLDCHDRLKAIMARVRVKVARKAERNSRS